MKPRSRKYYQKRKEESGEKKGSVTDADYNEENQTTAEQTPKKIRLHQNHMIFLKINYLTKNTLRKNLVPKF